MIEALVRDGMIKTQKKHTGIRSGDRINENVYKIVHGFLDCGEYTEAPYVYHEYLRAQISKPLVWA